MIMILNNILIKKLEFIYKEDDLSKAGSFQSLMLYQFLDPAAQVKTYHSLNISLKTKKAIAQLRLANKYISRVIILINVSSSKKI